MPSFLGRFLGLTFRTELLIMNILGLINSTLDWSPLKWTNKLEQIWNFSMPQKSLIVDTIGEDTIKTILSWIVITRIVIAHVYTFTYLSNIYPIITWSRPNLLLPWLILSFFKNVVLEVIVIVIGLLLWYGNPISLVVFLEFIFVKLVPLILASYNWYSNSCLFLQLRQTEKMKKLRRFMRSDSNLLTNQLYVKIDDPKYRTGSLTTLFSYDSYETYNPNLTPGQNAKKLLGITDQDVEDARARVKQTEVDRRLTELDDDIIYDKRSASIGYFIGGSVYESDLFLQRVSQISTIYQPEKKSEDKRDASGDRKNDPEILRERNDPGADQSSQENKDKEVHEGLEEKRNLVKQYKSPEIVQERLKNLTTFDDLEKIEEEEDAMVTNVTREVLAANKRGGTDLLESQKMKQQRTRSPTHEESIGYITRPKGEVNPTGESVKSVERSSSPVKLQDLFNCCCIVDDPVLKESRANSVKTTDLRTSTPRERSGDDNAETQVEENSQKPLDQAYTYAYNVTDVKTDFTMNSGFPLMEKLLKNDLEILKSIKVEEQASKKRRFDDVAALKIPKDDRSNMFLDGYGNHRNQSIDLQNISEIVKDLGASTKTTSTSKTEEYGSDRRQTGFGGAEDGTNRLQNATWRFEVFDGLYQNDFANNSELQCALQQMEKKKWNPFSGQTNLETLLTTTFPERNPPSLIDFWRPEEICGSSESASHRSVLTEDGQPPKIGANSPPPPTPLKAEDIPKPVVVTVMKNVATQTVYQTASKHSNSKAARHLIDAKPRSKYFRRLKRPQDQSDNASHVIGAKPAAGKRDYALFPRIRSKSPMLSKSSLNDKKRLNASKSFANKNDCDCKMQNLGGKRIPSTESSFDKRDEGCKVSAKQKVDSLATLPLAQAVRKPEASPLHSWRKPPVYPKETQMDSWWRTPSGRIDSLESKKLVDRQSMNSSRSSSSRTSSSRNRSRRPTEDQAARELRALKAYNEITLLKVKKELDVQKNLGRVNLNRDLRISYKRVASRNELGKENLSANTANETGYSSRSNKLPLNAAGRSTTVSNKRYTSKSSKIVNTSKEQKNFDRLTVAPLRLQQPNADLSDIGRMAEEIVSSKTSDVKLESAGHDLDRSKDKEDKRVSAASSVEAVGGRVGYRIEKPSARDVGQNEASRVDAENLKDEKKELLTLLNESAKEDAASTSSASSVTGSSHKEQIQDLPIVKEEVLDETSDSTAGSMTVAREEVTEQSATTLVTPRSVKTDEEDDRGSSLVPASLTWRNRDSNADLWGDIVDNVSPAKLHNFYSYKLMDSLLYDSKMEEFSTFSQQVDRFDKNASEIRETRDLDQAPRSLIVCTAGMDHRNIPNNPEIEPDIDDIEDGQGFRLNEDQLRDILSSVTEVLRNLNIDENAENRSRTKDATLEKIVEIFDDLLEDGFQDIGEIPKFIKEDIFMDIKFPIMISATEINPGLAVKTFNVFPLQMRLDRDAERVEPTASEFDAEFVEPMGSDFDGLTVITEENEEDAEEAGARGVRDSNLEKFALKLASSCKFLGSTRIDEFEDATEVEIEEDYHSAVGETFSSSMECVTFIEVPGYVEELASNALKVDMNKTYDILNGLDSNEDTDEPSFKIEEIHENIGEDNAYDSGTVDAAGMSIETEKVWKVFSLEDDQCGMMDAGIEEVIEKLKESVQIEIGESVDVGETESRVQDDQIGERDVERVTEVAEIQNAMGSEKFGKNFADENTEEGTEVRDGSQPVETVFHQVEEAKDCNYGNIIVRRNEDDERNRKVDKHAQEEDVGNEVFGEDVRVEEVEDGTKDVDVRSSIEIDRPHASIVKFKEREENVLDRVLGPVCKSNTILAEEREDLVHQIEISSLEIIPEETEVVETREEISLKTIFMFWLLVLYFYIRHFYRWMCSLTQVPRTTYTLRPFDVHTVVTSTSTLFEHTALLNRIQEGLVEEDEETLETSVNFETVNISRAIEERLRVVLDMTTERSVSRNSEFGLEEMAEELRRETLDLGLSSSEYLAEETRSEEPEEINVSSEMGEQEVLQATKLHELSPKNDQLDKSKGQIDAGAEEVQDAGRIREMSLSIDDSKVESSSGEGSSAMDKASESVEKTREENSSPVQFETTLEDMDSFYSLYTRPSVTTDTVSYTGLDGEDMEEFSIASNASDEPAQT